MTSDMERVWLAEYLKCFDATAAARKAGYKWPGRVGWQKKEKFAKEIDAAIQEKILSADEALSLISDAATFDPSPYIRQEGKLIWFDVKAMKEDGVAHHIREAYTTKDGPRIKMVDPDWAREVVLKHKTKGPAGTKDDPQYIALVNVDMEELK